MAFVLKIIALVVMLVAPGLVLYGQYNAGSSPDAWGVGQSSGGGGGEIQAAPGPIAGAGLPVLLLAGGVYWVVRRYRRKAQ